MELAKSNYFFYCAILGEEKKKTPCSVRCAKRHPPRPTSPAPRHPRGHAALKVTSQGTQSTLRYSVLTFPGLSKLLWYSVSCPIGSNLYRRHTFIKYNSKLTSHLAFIVTVTWERTQAAVQNNLHSPPHGSSTTNRNQQGPAEVCRAAPYTTHCSLRPPALLRHLLLQLSHTSPSKTCKIKCHLTLSLQKCTIQD